MNTSELDIIFEWLSFLADKEMIIFLIYKLPAIAKIHYKDLISLFTQSNKEVRGVDIIIDKLLAMYPLNPINELINNNQSSLHSKPPPTKPHQILQTRSIYLRNQRPIPMLNPIPVQVGYAYTGFY